MKKYDLKAFEYWRMAISFVTVETLGETLKQMDDDWRLTDRQYYLLRNIAIDTAYAC